MTLLRSVWKLLYAQWWILFNVLRRSGKRERVLYVALCAFTLGAALIIYVGARKISEFDPYLWPLYLSQIPAEVRIPIFDLNEVSSYVAFLVEHAPIVLFDVTSTSSLLFTLYLLLHVLYLSDDIEFLLAYPVPVRAVFAAKFVQVHAVDVDDIEHLVGIVTGEKAGLVEREPLRGIDPVDQRGDSGLRLHWHTSGVRYSKGGNNAKSDHASPSVTSSAERQI